MTHKAFAAILALLALTLLAAPVDAGGDVSVCDEAHLLAALSGGGTVTFSCSGTIVLSSTIGIAADTTIDGSGQAVTISGGNAVHVLHVDGNVTLNLQHLTIANGYGGSYTSGGGVQNAGTLHASDTAFTGNHSADGGAVANYGLLTLSNSTFTNNGAFGINGGIAGAIFNLGDTVVISDSTFLGNSSNTAGAIYNGGMLTISNSTFSNNSADPNTGGAIKNISGGTVIVTNSTFSGNSAVLFDGGGAISNAGDLTLKNSIVANSPSGSNCSGTITDGGGNLSYPDTTCPGLNADPVLGPLQDNGGPTLTMALGTGSAALDAADDAICAAPPVNNLDQRGVSRPQGAHCDTGAFEKEAVPQCPNFVPPPTVGVEDIQAIAGHWGETDGSPGWDPTFDLNGDHRIDIVDLTLTTAAFGTTC